MSVEVVTDGRRRAIRPNVQGTRPCDGKRDGRAHGKRFDLTWGPGPPGRRTRASIYANSRAKVARLNADMAIVQRFFGTSISEAVRYALRLTAQTIEEGGLRIHGS